MAARASRQPTINAVPHSTTTTKNDQHPFVPSTLLVHFRAHFTFADTGLVAAHASCQPTINAVRTPFDDDDERPVPVCSVNSACSFLCLFHVAANVK